MIKIVHLGVNLTIFIFQNQKKTSRKRYHTHTHTYPHKVMDKKYIHTQENLIFHVLGHCFTQTLNTNLVK